MYSVSNDFKTAMKKAARFEHVRGTIGLTPFTDANIMSLTYSNRCSDTKDVTFGSAYIGAIEVSFVGLIVARGSWQGQVITLEYGLEIDDQGTTEWVPVGVFTVASAEWSDLGVKVTAYDNMAKLDKPFTISATSGTLYDHLALACQRAGVGVGRTSAQMELLPNGDKILSVYENNDITSIRDYVSWIACSLGGFAYADRYGNITVKSWAESAQVDTIAARERVAGSTFSDFETLYDGISIVNMVDGATKYYSANAGVGATIAIGSNPLLQYGTALTVDSQRQALAVVANSINYTPFNIDLLNCPVYDFGDLLQMQGGVAGSTPLTCCVMSVEWTFKNTINLRGYGADPNLASGKTKTDKALNGMKSQTSENELTIHTFENAQNYTLLDSQQVEIIDIEFATITPKKVTLWHEVDLDLTITDASGVATCTAYYYLNDVLESYSPVTSWNNDGKHLLELMYYLDSLQGGEACEWRVELEIDGGTATIARGDVHAILMGQGLVAIDDFDGNIEITDTYTAITAGGIVAPITDDNNPLIELDGGATSYLMTEDMLNYITTENGDYITEET